MNLMSQYGCIVTSMKIFSQNRKFILYTNMCPVKYLSNCCPIYLCADVFFLKKVKCYSTFLLKWLLLMVLNFKYSFQNFHSNQICGISEHYSILCLMTQTLQFWFNEIPMKKIQVDIPQVNMYCLRIHNVMKLIHFVIAFYSVSLE